MLELIDVIKDNLTYIPTDKVRFHSPDADREFDGVIKKVSIEMDEHGLSLNYHIHVMDDGTVGKYYGTHILTDDYIKMKIE
jgi:hypothetical protein